MDPRSGFCASWLNYGAMYIKERIIVGLVAAIVVMDGHNIFEVNSASKSKVFGKWDSRHGNRSTLLAKEFLILPESIRLFRLFFFFSSFSALTIFHSFTYFIPSLSGIRINTMKEANGREPHTELGKQLRDWAKRLCIVLLFFNLDKLRRMTVALNLDAIPTK